MKKPLLAFLMSTAICASPALGQRRIIPRTSDMQASDEVEAAAQPTTTGKFVFNVAITISSPGISSGVVSCQADADLVSNSSGLAYAEEHAAVKATLKGSTGTCSVHVPYDWQVRSSQDYVLLKVALTAGPSTGLPSNLHLCSHESCGCVTGLPSRISEKQGTRIPVPLSGSTTTESLAFTL
jgi:hypothetical protein